MRVGPARIFEDAAAMIEFDRLDLSDRIKPTKINDGDFSFNTFRFIKTVTIRFWGNLAEYSKLSYEIYDSYPITAKNVFLSFDHYDAFLKILSKKEKFTTEQYKKILNQ